MRNSSPRSRPETVRKRSSPSGSNTEGSRAGGALAGRASSRPFRQEKTVSSPSDHQRPSNGTIPAGGASSGDQTSDGGASSSSAASARSSPVSASLGHVLELVSTTAPIRS